MSKSGQFYPFVQLLYRIREHKKQIFITFISTFGIIENKHSSGLIDNIIELDALFKNVSETFNTI